MVWDKDFISHYRSACVENLKPVTPKKRVYIYTHGHIFSQVYMIYTNFFRQYLFLFLACFSPIYLTSSEMPKKHPENLIACYKMLFPVDHPAVPLWWCFLTISVPADSSWTSNHFKNHLLNFRMPRTACFSLNRLPDTFQNGTSTGQHLEIKARSNS